MNSFLDYSDLPRIIIEALVILSFGVLVGLSLHFQLVRDVLEGNLKPGPGPRFALVDSDTSVYPEPVDLQTVQTQLAAGALLIDARISELYRDGHLPGSISLPLDEADLQLATFPNAYPIDTPLVVYCNGYGCPDSFDLAVRLKKRGYRRVMVFEGGYPEWESAGLPLEKGN